MLYCLIVNYNSYSLISRLIKSISIQEHQCKIIIINNSPVEQNDLKQLESDSVKVIDAGYNIGFGSACNLGISEVYNQDNQALVWLLNPDTFLSDETLSKVVSLFPENLEFSILGTLIYSSDQKVWFGGGTFDKKSGSIFSENLFSLPPHQPYISCDWVSGCSMIVNLKQFQECPQFDRNYFLYYEDFDFCQRYKRQGHIVAVTHQISIVHEVSTITNRNLKNKFYHSTYSYLFTLERYTDKTVFYLRLTRLLIYALILIPIEPAIALGKITGAWHYFQKRLSSVTPFID